MTNSIVGFRSRIAAYRGLAAGVAALFLLAGCEDEGPTGPSGGEFDAAESAATVQEITSTADDDSDVGITLDLLSERLSDGGSLSTVVAPVVSRGLTPGVSASALDALREDEPSDRLLRPPTLTLLIPDALLGKTLVYNPDTGRYEVDDSRSDAPDDGVRFVMYATDPETRRPSVPLEEIGYVDIVDETSSDTGLRLRIRAVDTSGDSDVTLVDYFVEGSVVLSGDTEITATAEGFISDGTRQLDFTLSQELSVPAGSSTADLTTDYTLSLPDAGVTATLATQSTVDLETGETTSAALQLTLDDGESQVVVDVEVDGSGALSGTVAHNGRTVVEIGGTLSEPSFTRPDGSELSDAERQALRDLVDAIENIADFAEHVLGVFDPES